MTKRILPLMIIVTGALVGACAPAVAPTPAPIDPWSQLQVLQTVTPSVDGTTARDVFMVLNNASGRDLTLPPVDATSPANLRQLGVDDADRPPLVGSTRRIDAAVFSAFQDSFQHRQQQSSRGLLSRVTPSPVEDQLGMTTEIYALGSDLTTTTKHTAVVKYLRQVQTRFGTRQLTIMVDQPLADQFTDPMLNALADAFLKAGLDNDIYDGVTQITGVEAGPVPVVNGQPVDAAYLPDDHCITLFFKSLTNPKSQVTLGGYVDPSNSFVRNPVDPQSNERQMFVLNADDFLAQDSETDANGNLVKKPWSIAGSGPRTTLTTVTHEFQHLVEVYQRYILRGVVEPAWLNEMMSMAIEDLMAERLGSLGILGRPVAGTDGAAGTFAELTSLTQLLFDGRLNDYAADTDWPFFNWKSDNWEKIVNNYSVHGSLAAYLLRNYGGPALVDRLMTASSSGRTNLQAALQTAGFTGANLSDLLNEFSQAVVHSNEVHEVGSQPTFNRGGWFSFTQTVGTDVVQYRLASANFFRNYSGFFRTLAGYRHLVDQGLPFYADSLMWIRLGRHVTDGFQVLANLPAGVTYQVISVDMINPANLILQ